MNFTSKYELKVPELHTNISWLLEIEMAMNPHWFYIKLYIHLPTDGEKWGKWACKEWSVVQRTLQVKEPHFINSHWFS
jgi:hypothetical protein